MSSQRYDENSYTEDINGCSGAICRERPDGALLEQQGGALLLKFACPKCIRIEFLFHAGQLRPCYCDSCSQTYPLQHGKYIDFVVTTAQGKQPTEVLRAEDQHAKTQKNHGVWIGSDLFRLSLVSAIYERGWRQGFNLCGFPGKLKEFEMAMTHFAKAATPTTQQAQAAATAATASSKGVVLDVSCGTGLFSRLFACSGYFRAVVALDFSESMLLQAQQLVQADKDLTAASTPIFAVRADVGQLPCPASSIDAAHAGAAIHCWRDPAAGLAEICRVLKPGGVFVATTFLTPLVLLEPVIGQRGVDTLNKLNPFSANWSHGVRMWQDHELQQLTAAAGLVNYRSYQRGMFIMFAAAKPS